MTTASTAAASSVGTASASTPGSSPGGSALVRAPSFQPMYNPARLLSPSAAQAVGLLEAARAELSRAQSDAERIRESARRDAESIREDARRDSMRAADEARAAAARETRQRADRFFERFAAETSSLADQVASHAQRSGFRIASAILKAEFAARPDVVIDVVSSALREAKLYEKITVCVHPDDLAVVEPSSQKLRAVCSIATSFALRADSDVPPGGVRIDTEMGSFDGSLDARLSRLAGGSLGGGAS